MSNAQLSQDLLVISKALGKTSKKITITEARTIIFDVENVSPESQMTADDIIGAAWESDPYATALMFPYGAVTMLKDTANMM